MKKSTLLFLLLFGFVANSYSQASLCEDAVSVSLPYSTTDDTTNYGDNYFGSPGISDCGTPNNFLNGNDVVYAYTATFDGSINLSLSTNSSYVGLFAYGNCEDIGEVCLAGTVMEDVNSEGYLSLDAFPVTTGNTYYFVISSWPDPQTVSYHLNIATNTCTNAIASYTVISDCSITDQFLVAVNIESLGSAASLTVYDDYGSATQNLSAEGLVTFGPYPNETQVTITITNNQDANCFITSAPQTQLVCAPINNFCSGAIDLALEVPRLDGTTIGATNQNNTSCNGSSAAGDVYYKILVPNTYSLWIGQTNNDYDSVVTAFLGDCDNQIELTCFDEDDLTVFNYTNNTGTDQTFYWVQDGFNGETGTFTLDWQLSNCVVPEALYTVIPDCENGEQYLVNADVYTLGSATSVTVTDNMGSDPQTLTEVGQIQFGPYDNASQLIFTVTNDDDASCFLDSQIVTQEDCPPTCVSATVNTNVALNCPAAGFFVDLNITDLGTATSITISDNQGSASQNVTATGQIRFGPYPDYTPIQFSISDDEDNDCLFTIDVQSYSVCPPINDACSNAIALMPWGNFEASALITTSLGATLSADLPTPTCGNMFFTIFGKDVWYTVEVPPSGSMTIETASSEEGGFDVLDDTVLQVYSGDCNGLTALQCDNDSGFGSFSSLSLSGRTAGEILYVRAFGANGTQGSFKISAFDASLSNDDFDNAGFKAFPNPVKDILNISHSNLITNISVYNLLGQEVLTKSINANHSQVDLSNLPKGTYLVRIAADDRIKTIKVIKD